MGYEVPQDATNIPIEYQFRLRELVNKVSDYLNMYDTCVENKQISPDDKQGFINATQGLADYVARLDNDNQSINSV